MIDVYVANYYGRSLAAKPSASFDSGGGTIGRVADNHFVLPDPARHVSRRHARIRSDAGHFFIANISDANPLFLNDAEIKPGEECPLSPGDEVRIGLYLLGVRSTPLPAVDGPPPAHPRSEPNSGPGTPAYGSSLIGSVDPIDALSGGSGAIDPFADLMGSALPASAPGSGAPRNLPNAEPQRAAETSPVAQSLRSAEAPAPREAAPVPPSNADPFADLLGSNTLWKRAAAGALAPGRSDPEQQPFKRIPEDFDWLDLPSSTPRNSDDPLRDMGDSSINLESVDANAERSSLLDFPLTTERNLQDPLHGGTPSLVDSHKAVDPLALFGSPDHDLLGQPDDPPAQPTPMPDNVPNMRFPFTPPRSTLELPARSSPESRQRHSEPPSIQPNFLCPSPLEPPPAKVPGEPTPPNASVQSGAGTAGRDRAAAVEFRLPPTSPSPEPIDPNAASVPALDALLAAFLKGAGVPNTSIRNGLTPELMESLGSLVRNATAGAMELIAARQITKREVRAEVTMLVPKGNNPLKFLPTPEAAIMQMLDPRIPGFTSTADAMLEVFDDLRGHQVGIIAGIRAALADVLLRFDPAVLERRLGESGLLASLVPASRQAKLWQLYETQFQQIAREAEDNYHALFGDAFAKAYAEQVPQKHGKRGAS